MNARPLVLVVSLLTGCGSGVDDLAPVVTPPARPASEPPPVVPPEPEPPVDEPTPEPATPPIVLMHGMAGFADVGGFTYYYGVADELTDAGFRVYATEVDPFNVVEARAAQVAAQLDAILADSGAAQVHLIAHSQGGLDARWLIAQLGYGDRVASLTTISTPHHGSRMTDAVLGLVPGFATAATAAVMDLFLAWGTGTDADIEAQVRGMAHSTIENEFNPVTPDDPRVAYYSYAGVTQPWPWVDASTTDIVNPVFLSSYWVTEALEGANDGLVSVESARWGDFLGTLPADHGDEIGMVPYLPQPAFDHLAFYRDLASFLYGRGPAPSY